MTKIEDIEKEFREQLKTGSIGIESFYRQKISELVKEAIGKGKDDVVIKEIDNNGYVDFAIDKDAENKKLGYNQAKAEITAAFKEAGVEI